MRRLLVCLLVIGLLLGTVGTATAKPKTDWNIAPVAIAHLVDRLELLNDATCAVEVGGTVSATVGGASVAGDHLEVTIRCDR